MTDRELLELAAKAAGYTLREHYTGFPLIAEELNAAWNPLTDDGDALRLAVKVELSPSCFTTAGLTIVSATDRPFTELEVEEEHNGDPLAATRRAIVRAAAEIGRNME